MEALHAQFWAKWKPKAGLWVFFKMIGFYEMIGNGVLSDSVFFCKSCRVRTHDPCVTSFGTYLTKFWHQYDVMGECTECRIPRTREIIEKIVIFKWTVFYEIVFVEFEQCCIRTRDARDCDCADLRCIWTQYPVTAADRVNRTQAFIVTVLYRCSIRIISRKAEFIECFVLIL